MEEGIVISAIEPQKKKKDRYNIYADGEYVASLGAQALVRFDLRAGRAVDAGTFAQAVLEDNAQYAFDSAAALLAHKMRTRGELEQKLGGRGVSGEAIALAMDKLTAYGYVDDAAYAREYVQSAVEAGRLGRRAVQYRLAEKGLGRGVIDAAMALYTGEAERAAAAKQAQALAARQTNADPRKRRQSVYAALMRHGFDCDIIGAVLSEDED